MHIVKSHKLDSYELSLPSQTFIRASILFLHSRIEESDVTYDVIITCIHIAESSRR